MFPVFPSPGQVDGIAGVVVTESSVDAQTDEVIYEGDKVTHRKNEEAMSFSNRLLRIAA